MDDAKLAGIRRRCKKDNPAHNTMGQQDAVALLAEVDCLQQRLAELREALPSLHVRRCHDCGHESYHVDNVVPWVTCRMCSSKDTRRLKGQLDPVNSGRVLVDQLELACLRAAKTERDKLRQEVDRNATRARTLGKEVERLTRARDAFYEDVRNHEEMLDTRDDQLTVLRAERDEYKQKLEAAQRAYLVVTGQAESGEEENHG